MHPNTPAGIRYRSSRQLFGLPLISIAVGPDPERGEWRGRARGLLAIGDIATGWIALGGLARGGLAIGGLAMGGVGVGALAAGGAAIGYYAYGGAAYGMAVVSALRQDSTAVAFLEQWAPFLPLP